MTQMETTLDSAKYLEIVNKSGGLLDVVKAKMHWLKNEDIIIQHDGARPNTGKGNEEMLKKQEMKMHGIYKIRLPARSIT